MASIRLRYILSCVLAIMFSSFSYGQNAQGSDIASKTFLNSDGTRSIEQRVYDNGLGDIIQEVQSYPNSNLPDVIVAHEYDAYRRKIKTWLPVTSSSGGGFVKNVAELAKSQYSDAAPFARTEYDEFIPTLPSAQYKAGTQWQDNDKKISKTYTEDISMGMSAINDGVVHLSQYKLYLCNKTVDEDGCPRIEYTDEKGRLLISENSQGKTYYTYNIKGDLSHVFPPALSKYILYNQNKFERQQAYLILPDTDEMVQKYAYIYRYDYQRHCIYKKLPDCEPIYYIYDSTGNCILTQDGNQRKRGEWTYSIPDKFGRPCISGICHNKFSYSSEPLHSVHVFAEYDGSYEQTKGYAVKNIALDSPVLYSATYYDDYSFIGHNGVPTTLATPGDPDYSIDTSIGRGLQTGSVTAYMNENGVAGYTYSAMFYDSRYKVARTISTNHLGGVDITNTAYSYTGKPSRMRIRHNEGMKNLQEENYLYEYDAADRLQSISHKLNNGDFIRLRSNTYNGLGQMTSVYVPVMGGVHTTNYEYDMHSWLTKIDSGNLFQEKLNYASSENGSTACYNGNISSIDCIFGNYGYKQMSAETYKFLYDDASRLINADYFVKGIYNDKYFTHYKENGSFFTNYSYDCMGNILSLKRKGLQDGNTYGYIDDLTMNYDGNHLLSVKDAITDPTYNNAWNFMDGTDKQMEYEYDENGNMTKDLNKNILSIQYNSLNLPASITFKDGKTIQYTYGADGRKLKVVYTTKQPSTTHVIDYCGNMIYEEGKLKRMLVDGAYISFDKGYSEYFYYIQDHLGNNRVIFNIDSEAEQMNRYYPYGGLMAESTGWDVQRYKYNGKEFDRMHGLDWYDYGARMYDPAVGQYHTMDRFAEKYYNLSPYSYCAGNPINAIDVNGDSINVAYLQLIDNTFNKTFTDKLISDWKAETGLNISVSENGNINYDMDKNGNPIVNTNGNGEECGSESARAYLIKIIDSKEKITLLGGARTAAIPGTNDIGVSFKQIESFISGTSKGLDNRTLGWGMTMLHEITHTNLGGGYKDDMSSSYSTGKTVDFMNEIRSELNSKGLNFGIRQSYLAIPYGNKSRIYFGKKKYIQF